METAEAVCRSLLFKRSLIAKGRVEESGVACTGGE